jgi:hypothetical protein
MDPSLAGSPRELDIGRCFNDAVDVYKRNFLTFFLAAFLFEILSIPTLFILAGPLFGGICLMTLRGLREPYRTVNLGDLFGAFDHFGTLVGLFFLTLVLELVGLCACIVPGLVLMTIWLFPTYLVVERNLPLFDALGASQAIVSRHGFGKAFLLVLLILLIGLVPSLIPYAGIVLYWFVAPVTWLMTGSAYLQLTSEAKPEFAEMEEEEFRDRAEDRPELREAIKPPRAEPRSRTDDDDLGEAIKPAP